MGEISEGEMAKAHLKQIKNKRLKFKYMGLRERKSTMVAMEEKDKCLTL